METLLKPFKIWWRVWKSDGFSHLYPAARGAKNWKEKFIYQLIWTIFWFVIPVTLVIVLVYVWTLLKPWLL
ncbi:MAG: hypothetical protein Q7S79_01915 [bacterium]|nr:hypothetical protein [bacterium]